MDQPVSSAARAVLAALEARAVTDGRATASTADLCAASGLGRTSVFAALKELRVAGLASVESSGRGRSAGSSYVLPANVRETSGRSPEPQTSANVRELESSGLETSGRLAAADVRQVRTTSSSHACMHAVEVTRDTAKVVEPSGTSANVRETSGRSPEPTAPTLSAGTAPGDPETSAIGALPDGLVAIVRTDVSIDRLRRAVRFKLDERKKLVRSGRARPVTDWRSLALYLAEHMTLDEIEDLLAPVEAREREAAYAAAEKARTRAMIDADRARAAAIRAEPPCPALEARRKKLLETLKNPVRHEPARRERSPQEVAARREIAELERKRAEAWSQIMEAK